REDHRMIALVAEHDLFLAEHVLVGPGWVEDGERRFDRDGGDLSFGPTGIHGPETDTVAERLVLGTQEDVVATACQSETGRHHVEMHPQPVGVGSGQSAADMIRAGRGQRHRVTQDVFEAFPRLLVRALATVGSIDPDEAEPYPAGFER